MSRAQAAAAAEASPRASSSRSSPPPGRCDREAVGSDGTESFVADGEAGDEAAAAGGKIRSEFSEDFSWGRSFARYVGKGYVPDSLALRLEGLELIEQLFVIRAEMKLRIRYELGRATIRRPKDKSGRNKPVTYASNIWNRGYANCAGHCIVFAAVLQMLSVPYCIVAIRSPKSGVPKHAILEVGFPESTDTRAVNCRAHELWTEYHGRKSVVKRDKETNEARWVKLFRGLKFTHSREGSEAAKLKGAGRWLWMDPLVNVGYYLHLVDNGYMIQDGKGFSFALPPEIKTWREVGQSSLDVGAGQGDRDLEA